MGNFRATSSYEHIARRCGSSGCSMAFSIEARAAFFGTFSQLNLTNRRAFFWHQYAHRFCSKTSAGIGRSVRTSSGVLWLPNCGSQCAARALITVLIHNTEPATAPPPQQKRAVFVMFAQTWPATNSPARPPARREPAVYLTLFTGRRCRSAFAQK
ncbi:hypothetical protein KCP73_00710 [Salmonella enterica subsp. enterica]|nr:hypothetical protein KCP73_00710 [Salmonella enterica subsp. enterica]